MKSEGGKDNLAQISRSNEPIVLYNSTPRYVLDVGVECRV
jgi:hypothetical protein